MVAFCLYVHFKLLNAWKDVFTKWKLSWSNWRQHQFLLQPLPKCHPAFHNSNTRFQEFVCAEWPGSRVGTWQLALLMRTSRFRRKYRLCACLHVCMQLVELLLQMKWWCATTCPAQQGLKNACGVWGCSNNCPVYYVFVMKWAELSGCMQRWRAVVLHVDSSQT